MNETTRLVSMHLSKHVKRLQDSSLKGWQKLTHDAAVQTRGKTAFDEKEWKKHNNPPAGLSGVVGHCGIAS